jgi:predicted CXXCH cytochrome family protein
MKRLTQMTSIGVAVAGVVAAAAFADIVGTSHDFTNTSWGGGEICKPCHTPHFSDTDVGFLWAHDMSDLQYTLYNGDISQPGGADLLDTPSRMCMSCHDGNVALNAYHGGGGPPLFIGAAYRIGENGNLADDHPIGDATDYPTTGSSGLNVPTLSPSGFWGFGGTGFPEVPLFEFNGKQIVSCSTCHTPHGKAGIDNLLRKDNAASGLCLTCHIK